MFAIYATILGIIAIYVLFKGQSAGRISIVVYATAVLATEISSHQLRSNDDFLSRLAIIDSTALACLLLVALLSKRSWPLWVSALQLNTVVAELVVITSAHNDWPIVYVLTTVWGLPTICIMAIGVLRDNRAGVTGNGFGRKAAGA